MRVVQVSGDSNPLSMNIPNLTLSYRIAKAIEKAIRYIRNMSMTFIVVLLLITPVFA